jgi:hypothetical protein
MEAMNPLPNQTQLRLYSFLVSQASIIKATNKRPCKPPTMVTAMGIDAKYLRGIAIKRSTRKEIPSARATLRNN